MSVLVVSSKQSIVPKQCKMLRFATEKKRLNFLKHGQV